MRFAQWILLNYIKCRYTFLHNLWNIDFLYKILCSLFSTQVLTYPFSLHHIHPNSHEKKIHNKFDYIVIYCFCLSNAVKRLYKIWLEMGNAYSCTQKIYVVPDGFLDLQWINIESYTPHHHRHTFCISLYSTHWRQTTWEWQVICLR